MAFQSWQLRRRRWQKKFQPISWTLTKMLFVQGEKVYLKRVPWISCRRLFSLTIWLSFRSKNNTKTWIQLTSENASLCCAAQSHRSSGKPTWLFYWMHSKKQQSLRFHLIIDLMRAMWIHSKKLWKHAPDARSSKKWKLDFFIFTVLWAT